MLSKTKAVGFQETKNGKFRKKHEKTIHQLLKHRLRGFSEV